MTDTLCFSRRDLLKGGGALVIGFSIAGSPPPLSRSRREKQSESVSVIAPLPPFCSPQA